MSRPRVVVVDDEPLARQILSEFISRDGRFEIAAECEGGRMAIDTIREVDPEILLLDVQMPEVDGFDVLTALSDPVPVTIMVTAYHEHAIRAFDYHALDYVLKPIDQGRLQRALDRALTRVSELRASSGMEGLLGALRKQTRQQERIVLKCSGSILFLEPDELLWVEAAGNYLKVEVGGREYLARDSIQRLIERLDPAVFVRIHRSFIVNARYVVEAKLLPGGSDYVVVLRDGRELPLGRSFRSAVLARLGLR